MSPDLSEELFPELCMFEQTVRIRGHKKIRLKMLIAAEKLVLGDCQFSTPTAS